MATQGDMPRGELICRCRSCKLRVHRHIVVRPAIVFWFLIVCPGMVLVRFLRLKEPAIEWDTRPCAESCR